MNTTNIHVRFVKFLIITFVTFFKDSFTSLKNTLKTHVMARFFNHLLFKN